MKNRQIVGLFVIILGLSFLFDLPFFNILISLIVIYIGVQVMTGKSIGFPFVSMGEAVTSEDSVKRVLIFSSLNVANESENFIEAEIITIFGEGKIDLRNATAANDHLKINLVSIFGAINLRVPEGWEVTTEGVGILGTFSNNTSKPVKNKTAVREPGC